MSATPSDRDDEVLPEIAGYALSRVLGHGGMSTVYLGEQLSLEREVAVKVMLPEALADEVSRRRFENEARTIARLEHPHIVGIYEVGRTRAGLPWYAMPYLARGHLGQRDFTQDGIEHGHARVRAILHALLAALDYAHARGVVHRDVKAENVLFDEAERPLLADFGIALRRFGPRVTTAGMAVGSTAYMAPEQARGEDVDARADLYSVGVLAWEMLAGKLPYVAGDALSMAVMHAQDPIPRLPRHLRHWQRFLDKALAKSPAHRFRSAQQMREALDRVPRRGGQQPLVRMRDQVRRSVDAVRRWPIAASLAAMLVLAAAVGVALRHAHPAPGDGFFRAITSVADSLPVPGAQPGQTVTSDVLDPMLKPLPESPAERWVAAAEQQLQAHNLTAPAGGNASESVVAAWKADPAHPRLATTYAALLGAFGDEAERRLRKGDDARARDYIDHANQLAVQTGKVDGADMRGFRQRLGSALQARMETAARKFDRAAATRTVDNAVALGLDARQVATLTSRANAIPKAGATVPGDAGMRLVKAGSSMLAAASEAVSRADYARFATTTGRTASLCRERASLLRLVKPISWQSPGFSQSPSQPVVCVSWGDAEAYARWLSSRSGHRYRLPTGSEADALPAGGGARAVSEWLSDCRSGCRERLSHGRSWRGAAGVRALDANRGYDDVGFRLVREP